MPFMLAQLNNHIDGFRITKADYDVQVNHRGMYPNRFLAPRRQFALSTSD